MNITFARAELAAAKEAVMGCANAWGIHPKGERVLTLGEKKETKSLEDVMASMDDAAVTGHCMVLISRGSSQSAAAEGEVERTIIVCNASAQQLFKRDYRAKS
jgi:hypothetical protein